MTISVGVSPDVTAVVDATRDLAGKFNAFLENLAANPSLLSPGLASRLQGAADGLKSSLESLGLASGANGALQLSEAKLRDALATNPTAVENVLGGPGGFASKIAAITRAVQVSPEILTTLARGQDNTPYSSSITQADRLETRRKAVTRLPGLNLDAGLPKTRPDGYPAGSSHFPDSDNLALSGWRVMVTITDHYGATIGLITPPSLVTALLELQ